MDIDSFQTDLEDEGTGWIVTYADLMTLLLVFFVLLYSISALNIGKFKMALNSIQRSLGEKEPPIEYIDVSGTNETLKKPIELDQPAGIDSRRMEVLTDIQTFIEGNDLGGKIDAFPENGSIVIRIAGTVLFEPGAATLNGSGVPVLKGIGQLINKFYEFNVNIKGHTDNVPIATKQFPSNWELSAIRATTVLKFLINNGIHPRRLTATGYGELLPLYPNSSAEGRARNRRVEFVLEKAD
ncbi:MAG: OmpA family protein [Desulfobacterales bacterium]